VNTEESEFSRLVKEERTGPGWKHSRQKLPRQTVVGCRVFWLSSLVKNIFKFQFSLDRRPE